jgi:TPR repeat protein
MALCLQHYDEPAFPVRTIILAQCFLTSKRARISLKSNISTVKPAEVPIPTARPSATSRAAERPLTHRSRQALAFPFAATVVLLVLGFASGAATNSRLAWTFGGVAGVLLAWQGCLYALSKRRGQTFAWEFVATPSHYVQASVQFAIYAYWGWYWRNVYTEAPLILAQVAFLYALDALVTWSRGQTWRVGFGAWPIIFSTNLFMWFKDDWFIFQFLMVATGVLGKQFIRWRRDGKITHIFNPSAFGLTLFSLALIFTGTTGYTWGEQIALTQGRPPHIYLEIFLCGMVVQYFFFVTLMTFSAAGMLALLTIIYTKLSGVYLFVDSNIPIAVFLGLHLLMTDPATTPRSSLGRIMFGSLYGAGVFAAFIILDAFHVPTFYDKLVVVPLLNLLTPVLDRIAAFGMMGRFGKWEASVGPRRMNLAFMGGWIVLFLAMLGTGFVEAPHPGATIGFWKKAAEEKRPHATENLLVLLAQFEKQDLNDPTKVFGSMGSHTRLDRAETLGVICQQAGLVYAEGKIIPPEPARAAHFFNKACAFGNAEGCANFAVEYLFAKTAGVEGDITRALAMLEQACPQTTNGRICFIVGYACETGRTRAVDKAKARSLYSRGAALGDLEACKRAGRMAVLGEGGPVDPAAAIPWLQKAVDAQDGQSCLYLSKLYHLGEGVPQDEPRAVALLEKACNLGVQPACDLLKQSKR